MRNSVRLLIFAAVVAVITFTIAPPVRTSAEAGGMAPQVTSAPAELTGTYVGSITPDTPGELPDSGMIVIRRDGETLAVTAGPNAETQYPTEKVMRTAGGLTFELTVVGDDATRVLQFDLKIDGREMTGAIALLRDGVRSGGRLAFTKQ